MKQTISFRHRLMADVLKRVKPQFGTEEMRMVACFALRSLPHEQACRLAKRHGWQNPKDPRDLQMAEKARTLYKKTDAAGLAVLIFEAMLLGSTESISHNKDDDSLTIAAALHKIDTKALRASVVKEEREKVEKKAKKVAGKLKSQPVSKRAASNKTDTRSGGCPEKASPRSVNIPTRAGFVQVDLPENGPQPAMHPTMN